MNEACKYNCQEAESCHLGCEKPEDCAFCKPMNQAASGVHDMVNHPNHYGGSIEVIDYIRDKLTAEGFTEYCCGNVLKYISRWRKKDGVQDLKKAQVYLGWMIESAERESHDDDQH